MKTSILKTNILAGFSPAVSRLSGKNKKRSTVDFKQAFPVMMSQSICSKVVFLITDIFTTKARKAQV